MANYTFTAYADYEQECDECGRAFRIRYNFRDGSVWYEYLDTTCDCTSSFHPTEGNPSISQWCEHFGFKAKEN